MMSTQPLDPGKIRGYGVYVLEGLDGGESVRPMKIGMTYNIQSRIRSLESNSPFRVQLRHWEPCGNRTLSLYIEGLALKYPLWRRLRTHGEWFTVERGWFDSMPYHFHVIVGGYREALRVAAMREAARRRGRIVGIQEVYGSLGSRFCYRCLDGYFNS